MPLIEPQAGHRREAAECGCCLFAGWAEKKLGMSAASLPAASESALLLLWDEADRGMPGPVKVSPARWCCLQQIAAGFVMTTLAA